MFSWLDPGSIRLEDGKAIYVSEFYGSWEIPMSDIRIVGSLRHRGGMFVEHWFRILVDSEGTWCAIPQLADGYPSFEKELVSALPGLLLPKIADFPDVYAEHVQYPIDLQGAPLFTLKLDSMPEVMEWVFAPWRWNIRSLSSEVLDRLGLENPELAEAV